MRGHMVAVIGLTALIGAFEALLFALVGEMVDWISIVEPSQLFAQRGRELFGLPRCCWQVF